MSCKFKYGDRVWTGNHAGKIVSIRRYDFNYICKVKFENRFLIPQEMEYKESELELMKALNVEEKQIAEAKCTCGIAKTYGKIPKENHKYYCDLVRTPEAKKQKETTKKKHDDLLEQFELMLEGYYYDDDDDDDFGFFD